MFFAKTCAAICGLAAFSSAHMLLASPKPFTGVQQAPLEGNGANFPCQIPTGGSYPSSGTTSIAKGSPQELAFIGQAVHGGGSCQVSITYDTAPTRNSVWKVIHSIQGGCPAKGQAGNMGSSASAADPFQYSFQIPDGVPTGSATLAWTWLNRIGNREFYMNCAPITITGSSGDKSAFDALPDMAVANLPGINSCSTTEGKDYRYPNPGASVDNFNMTGLIPLNGDDCGLKAAAGSGSSGGSGSGASSPVSAPPAPTTTANAGNGSPTLPGGVFITVPTNGAAPASTQSAQPTPIAATTATAAANTPTSAAATATASPASNGGSGGSGSSSGSSGTSGGSGGGAMPAGTACSPEGLWNCVGGTSFQQCGSGLWSPVMQLAAGMKCTPGQSTTLDMKAINGKMRRRLARFSA